MQLPSPGRMILDILQESKLDKWGFVIYLITHEDDQGWELFRHLHHERTQNTINALTRLKLPTASSGRS